VHKNKLFYNNSMLKIRNLEISTEKPAIMGIINITPDSFYAGSRKQSIDDILSSVEQQINEGADIIDLGAYSSRPNAEDISIDEEWSRLSLALSTIRRNFKEIIISVDTFRASIAERAMQEGADIINDISGGNLDAEMFNYVAQNDVPYVLMHMRGTPQTMQTLNQYKDVATEVISEIRERFEKLKALGASKIMIDPGFGFAKNVEQNFELFSKLENFSSIEAPLLVGISRKSMIYKTLNSDVSDALNGTTVLNSIALMKGASILRVHDVHEAVECRTLIKKINQY
jgi:dihydropteroate synthase